MVVAFAEGQASKRVVVELRNRAQRRALEQRLAAGAHRPSLGVVAGQGADLRRLVVRKLLSWLVSSVSCKVSSSAAVRFGHEAVVESRGALTSCAAIRGLPLVSKRSRLRHDSSASSTPKQAQRTRVRETSSQAEKVARLL